MYDFLNFPSLEKVLLRSDFTARAEIEFTTRCNLRCVYCHSVQPNFRGSDLDLSYLDSIVEVLKSRNIMAVGVSGSGETTILEKWHEYCERMLDAGLQLFITTNLARELSDQEASTLAKFLIIQVSCDSAKPELYRKIRRGGDLKTLLFNMGKIRSYALRHNLRGPIFWWNTVVSDVTVFDLEEYVAFGLAHGVKHFNFLNMYEHPPVEGAIAVNHLTRMARHHLEQLPSLFDRVFALVRSAGGSFVCYSLLDDINRALGRSGPGLNPILESNGKLLKVTRDCLDPWIYIKVASDLGVRPCCATGDSLGFLGQEHFSDIFNNPRMMRYRHGILTGELEPSCRGCRHRGLIDVRKMKLKVALVMSMKRLPQRLHKWGMFVPLMHKMRS